MRRICSVLLALVIVGLVPSAALAARPSPTISSVSATATTPSTGPGCTVDVTVTYPATKGVRYIQIYQMLSYGNGVSGVSSGPHLVAYASDLSVSKTFYQVELTSGTYYWYAYLAKGSGRPTGAGLQTGYDNVLGGNTCETLDVHNP